MAKTFMHIIENILSDTSLENNQIAQGIGKPYAKLLREIDPNNARAKLGARTCLDIMHITGDHRALYYLAEHFGYELRAKANSG